MEKRIKNKIIWIPRIIIIIYILFISLFALDAQIGIGLLIHLLPSIILIIILISTLKQPLLAGILFILAGIGTIIFWNTYKEIFIFLIISLPPIIAGILFLMNKTKH